MDFVLKKSRNKHLRKRHKTITLEDIVLSDGVKQSVFCHNLEQGLPWRLMFFFSQEATKREMAKQQIHTCMTSATSFAILFFNIFFLCLSKVYLDYLKWEIDTESAFLELPLTILVLVSFAMLAMNILHQEQLYAIETAIERDIIENANFAWSGAFGHKGIEQVGDLFAKINSSDGNFCLTSLDMLCILEPK